MYRIFLVGMIFYCFGSHVAALESENPSKLFQAMVSEADSYSAAYRQYQSLHRMLLKTEGVEQLPEQFSFQGISQSQWSEIGSTLRQRALAESSVFDATLLLYLKQFSQSPPPKYCRVSVRWFVVATTEKLSLEQSRLFAHLQESIKACRQLQPFIAVLYAFNVEQLVEAYDRSGHPELAVEALKTGFYRLERRQEKDRGRLSLLLSHKSLDPNLAAISLRLAKSLQPAELRFNVLSRMLELPQFQNELPELIEAVGLPEQYSWKWAALAEDVAENGHLNLVEQGLQIMLALPDLTTQQRNRINSILALEYLIGNAPQASLDAYKQYVIDPVDDYATLLFKLAEHDESGVYIKPIMQLIEDEKKPTFKAYSLISFAGQYLKAGQHQLAVKMYHRALDIMFEANYNRIKDYGWTIVEALLEENLIEQAERINQRFNTETILLGGVGDPLSVTLDTEGTFAVAYARAGDFHKSQLLLLATKKRRGRDQRNALALIDIYIDAGEFTLAERVAAINFYQHEHIQAWVHVADGYANHGNLKKAKAKLDYTMGLFKHTWIRPSQLLLKQIAQGYARIELLPIKLLKMAKAMKDNSSLVDVARVYAEAGFNNLSLKAIAHIDTLDDQLVALRWFEFNDGTELRLDDTGKAQLVKIVQQHFPVDEFWRQSLNVKARPIER